MLYASRYCLLWFQDVYGLKLTTGAHFLISQTRQPSEKILSVFTIKNWLLYHFFIELYKHFAQFDKRLIHGNLICYYFRPNSDQYSEISSWNINTKSGLLVTKIQILMKKKITSIPHLRKCLEVQLISAITENPLLKKWKFYNSPMPRHHSFFYRYHISDCSKTRKLAEKCLVGRLFFLCAAVHCCQVYSSERNIVWQSYNKSLIHRT